MILVIIRINIFAILIKFGSTTIKPVSINDNQAEVRVLYVCQYEHDLEEAIGFFQLHSYSLES